MLTATGVAILAGALLSYVSQAESHVPAAVRGRQAAGQTLIKYLGSGSLTVPDSLGGGSVSATQLSGAVAVDGAGNLYVGVCDSDFKHRIVVFDPAGHYARDFEAGRCGTGEPVKIALGPDNLLYATRIGPSNEIGVFTPQGTQVRLVGGPGGFETITARDIELDSAGNIYVAIRCDGCGTDSDEVVRLNKNGQVTGRWQPLPPPYLCNGQCVKGIAPAPDGSVWVTTNDPNRELIHLDANGKPLPGAPHLDVIAPEASATAMGDVEFADGRLYVSIDLRVVVLDTAGRRIDTLGSGDRVPGVAVGGSDLYVTGLGSATTSARRLSACAACAIGRLKGEPVLASTHSWMEGSFPIQDCGKYSAEAGGAPAVLRLPRGTGCGFNVIQSVAEANPCPQGQRATPIKSYFNGQQAGSIDRGELPVVVWIDFRPDEFSSSGSVVLEWSCYDEQASRETFVFEWKGDVALEDPSGTVADSKTGRPVEAATVRLLFSPTHRGPFGIPGISGFNPQVNPESTPRNGIFGWDVAPGFWRLRVTAFGYFPLTSAVYKVPPPVTGLSLKLRPDPRSQRVLIDPYRARVGSLRLGARFRRAKGVKIRSRRGRIRGVTVLSKRFRTAAGVRLGSRVDVLVTEYPAPRTLQKKLVGDGRKLVRYRVASALFRVRARRVVGISIGR